MKPSGKTVPTTSLPGHLTPLGEPELRAGIGNILESITDAFQLLDAEWRITYMNPEARRFFAANGVDPDTMIGKRFFEDLFPDVKDSDIGAHMVRAMTERVPVTFESYYAPWNTWNLCRFEPMPEGGLANYFRDISERKGLEKLQRRLEAERDELLGRLQLQFDRMPIACILFDQERRIIEWNPAAEAIFGYRRDEVLGKDGFLVLVPPIGRAQAEAIVDRLISGDMTAHAVNENQTKDGRSIICEWHNTPLRDADGQVIALLSMAQDITERKRAEEALRESEERLAADLAAMTQLQEVSTRLVPAGDTPPLLLEIVDAAITITGADMGNIQLLDRDCGALKIVASRGFERPFLEFFAAVEGGEAACGTAARLGARVVVEDVSSSPVFEGTPAREVMLAAGVQAVQSTPLISRSRQLVGMLSTHYRSPQRPSDRDLRLVDLLARQAADWIERTQAEEALRKGEERFRHYFDLGLIGMAITSPTKGCLEVNDRICEILGYERTELLQMSWAEMTHPHDVAADIAQFNSVMAGEKDGYTLDKRWIRKDGRVIDSTISVNCVRRQDGVVEYFVALLEDVTERKQAEEALRSSEERYRSLISQVKDFAIFATDERGLVSSWNEGCQHVLGYAQREFVGLDVAELYSPDDRDAGIPAAELETAVGSGTVRHARWMMAKGGRRFFAMGSTAGRRDSAGALIGFSTVVRDLTQMKLSQDQLAEHGKSLQRLITERTDELERTTERLRRSERLASLGTLAAGLGHDMGNLILPLEVRLELLLAADLPPDLREHVAGIQKCTQYLKRLSTGLRMLAIDPSSRTAERTELKAWWQDVGVMLGDLLPHGVRLQHHLPDSPCWVTIGRVGLTQAVFNLIQNAADAMRERRSGRVSISADDDPDAAAVILRVKDEGPGMSDEVIRHCMDPYFSTKERGEGTGMGLAFVHGLVTGAGGRVELDSVIGRGTTVSLILPRGVPAQRIPDGAGAV